jgi:hypothetical protein
MRGGGGGGGRGRGGRGGFNPRERTSARDATSIESLFGKNTRYDHRVAKEHKFWEKSKKLRTYHRILRKEGFEQPSAGVSVKGSTSDDFNFPDTGAQPSIPSLQPEVFAAGPSHTDATLTDSHKNLIPVRSEYEIILQTTVAHLSLVQRPLSLPMLLLLLLPLHLPQLYLPPPLLDPPLIRIYPLHLT